MITLYRFGELGLKCDPSPYCLKLDTYLKISGLEHTVDKGGKHLQTAPKGKLPYINDDGLTMGDSNLIINYLSKKYEDKLDAHLTKEEKAIARGFGSMMEDAIVMALAHSRWCIDENWPTTKKLFFGSMPAILRVIVPSIARKSFKKSLTSGAYKGFSDEEILSKADLSLQALSDFLGDKKYFFGDKKSSLDAAAYGMLAQFYLIDVFKGGIYDLAKKYPNLEKFTNDFYEELS